MPQSTGYGGATLTAGDEKRDGSSNNKRKLNQKDIKGGLEIFEGIQHQNISHLAKIGVLQAKNKSQKDIGLLVRQKCVETRFYPFSIALCPQSQELLGNPQPTRKSWEAHSSASIPETRSGRIDLIATSYEGLREWITGLNMLIEHKKELAHGLILAAMQA